MELSDHSEVSDASESSRRLTVLKESIFQSLRQSGFSIIDNKKLVVPQNKDFIRNTHRNAVSYLREKKRDFISSWDDKILQRNIIDGRDLDLKNIIPKLIMLKNKEDNSTFNWIKMHWSIPISAGYGRRLRYLVYDEGNSAVIGIIGLADPVFGLRDRDNFIGWNSEIRKKRLKHMLDAFVLGSVPPYSMVLGGKLVASMLMSSKIPIDFMKKYKGKKAKISNEVFNGKLAAITTASALGKSSVYDRIKIPGSSQFLHVGWSSGSGEFQFFNNVYDEIFKLAHVNAEHLKNSKWGSGVRNRRTVILTGLKMLGLPDSLLYHNIKRELFLVPLGKTAIDYLSDKSKHIAYYNSTVDDISSYALERWVLPRANRKNDYMEFKKESYSLRDQPPLI
jgi:hypothetical protein